VQLQNDTHSVVRRGETHDLPTDAQLKMVLVAVVD